MEATDTELRLVLIGVTSYDIQATANKIMREKIYPNVKSTTEFEQWNRPKVCRGRSVKLIVAPGFMDNRAKKTPWQMKSNIQYELQKSDYQKGFHGVVMVVNYPFRWTDEARDTTQYAIDVMKQINLEKHGFLVFTNRHGFKCQYPGDTNRKFAEYLHNLGESEPELKNFLKIFSKRIFILETELDDADWNGLQVRRLYDSLSQVPGTFSLYAPALVVMYNHASYIMSVVFQCLKTAYSTVRSFMVDKLPSLPGYTTDDKPRRRKTSESYDTLEDAAESRQEPVLEAKVDVEDSMDAAMTDISK